MYLHVIHRIYPIQTQSQKAKCLIGHIHYKQQMDVDTATVWLDILITNLEAIFLHNKMKDERWDRLKFAQISMHTCIYMSQFCFFGLFSWPFFACSHLCIAFPFLFAVFCFLFLWAQFPFQGTISINNRRTVSSRVRPNRSKAPFPLHRSPLSYFKNPVFPILWTSIPKSQYDPFELSLADPVNHCFAYSGFCSPSEIKICLV